MKARLSVSLVLLIGTLGVAQPVDPSDFNSHVGRAVRLMQSRLYGEAAAEFEKALAIQPDNDTVRIQYATCLFAQERNGDARKQFEIERQRLGDLPGLTYYLGRLDLRANDFESAIKKLAPLESNPAFSDVSLYLGLAYMSAGQREPARECLERAAKNNPRDPEVHYRLARFYSVAGRTEEANREYGLYRHWTEDRRLAQQYAGECGDALRTQPIAQARVLCQRIADPNDPQRLILLGQLYSENGAFVEAIEPFRLAASSVPDSFDAWQGLGLSLFRLRRYAEALPPLRKAASLNPQFLDTLALLATTLHALGDDAGALPILERAHNLNPDDPKMTAVLEQLRATLKPKK
jgi:tetratricopeptide (TPR) repeat protein